MEKPQLINFIAKVMENSGFKVYKNFKTSQYMIDIYAVLPTTFGDFGVVVECNNYDKDFPVSIETLKHMEKVGTAIKASKVVVVTSSYFTEQSMNYALKKNIKLVDRSDLLALAKKYQDDNFRLDREDFHDMGYYGELVPVPMGETNNYSDDDVEYEDYDDGYTDYYDYEDDDYDYDYDTYMVTQRHSDPAIYQNSLYRKEYEQVRRPTTFSFIKSKLEDYMGLFDGVSGGSSNNSISNNASSDTSSNYPTRSLHRQSFNAPAPTQSSSSLVPVKVNNINIVKNKSNIFSMIKPYLGNPIVLVALVVVITWLLSFIGGLLKVDHIIISSLQILISLIISYGFSYIYGDRSSEFIIRGTIIFFISLIVLIILILI